MRFILSSVLFPLSFWVASASVLPEQRAADHEQTTFQWVGDSSTSSMPIEAISTPEWDQPLSPDSTANYIFNSATSLMQRWPNTLWRNGHSIVRATIPKGTILYHGRRDNSVPTEPEWLAFDFEHSWLFAAFGEPWVLSLVSTRELHLMYFDGSSAAKMTTGTIDSQDILVWGEVKYGDQNPIFWEKEKLLMMCKMGKERGWGLDGFIRMEMHFEVMLCDFSDGMELVSSLHLVGQEPSTRMPGPGGPRDPGRSPGREPPHYDEESFTNDTVPGLPTPGMPTSKRPTNWRGSQTNRDISTFEVIHAGSWHNRAPGETRVHVDHSGFITFYDESLTSLVEARRGKDRFHHRLWNISHEDAQAVLDEVNEVFSRPWEEKTGSGVDWQSVTTVIQKRYGDRLEMLKYIIGEGGFESNVTNQLALFRSQLLVMLQPYMVISALPPLDVNPTVDISWVSPIVQHCSTTQLSHLDSTSMTRQEKRIFGAVKTVLGQICGTLGRLWVDAFDIEAADEEEQVAILKDSAKTVTGLMEWLDWSMWVKCRPACGPEEMCYIPTWMFIPFHDTESDDLIPRCVRKIAPYTW